MTMRRTPSQKPVKSNYAAVPGSGPADKICLHCTYLVRDSCRFTCGQYMTLTKRQGGTISPQAPACRYFAQRAPRDPAKGT
jgi:hypothetical protein